ncbi:hypothetical protein OG909_13795 [Streptomyces sp. NBC_01754]|nr:hypothetical protein [Streptomyces sp. NBC_01754]WSC93268.1 hypothetical protein OG909_13795 [Streptomyces sp. NBC_01754]
MSLRISLVLLLGSVLTVLIRGGSLKGGPAAVSVLFGFFLAGTTVAPNINRFVIGVADIVGQFQF